MAPSPPSPPPPPPSSLPPPGARPARPAQLYDGYLFDLDGTLYLGDQLLPGAAHVLRALRRLDRKVLFLSNNPTKDPADYAAKLTALGIPAAPEEVLNTVITMVRWLTRHHPRATVFPIAEAPLVRALAAAGIRISDDPAQIDFVIASYDRTFDYRKLQIAFDAIWSRAAEGGAHPKQPARLLATNPDRYCPFPGGHGEPDAAAIIAAVEACTGARLERHVGKPDPFMLETALERLGLPADRCLMTGDRLYTDVRMARDAGMPSALVLTGDTTPAALAAFPEPDRPTYVLTRVDQVLPDGSY